MRTRERERERGCIPIQTIASFLFLFFLLDTNMTCLNSSISSEIFVSDLPSYGLIGLIIIGLILYVSYLIAYIRNSHPLSTVYIYLSQLSLLLVLISTSTFLFRPSAAINYICTIQNLSLQIFPFFLLLGYNIHLIHHWLFKTTRNIREKSCLISFSSFCIFVLILLIELSTIFIWFYYQQQQHILHRCETECHRRLFLCSLSLNFFLLFLFSFQSSIRYHYYNQKSDLIYLFISLLALTVTITWICLYLFTRLRSSLTLYMNNNSILAYGNLFFVYAFIGPLLFEELFYASKEEHTHKVKRIFSSSSSLRMKFFFFYIDKKNDIQMFVPDQRATTCVHGRVY